MRIFKRYLNIFKKIFKILKKISISIIAIIILLIIFEIAFRYFHLFHQSIYWVKPDHLIYYRPLPNSNFWVLEENDHPITGRFNKWGWRDRNWDIKKNRIRIAILGDSFVQALQIEEDRTFVRLCEKYLNQNQTEQFEIMNFGRGGFSPTEELVVLQTEVIKFNPDLVVVTYFPVNDYRDVLKDTATDTPRSFFYIDNDNKCLILDNTFTNSLYYKFTDLIISKLKIRSVLMLFLMKRIRLAYGRFISYQRSREKPSIPKKKSGQYSISTAQKNATYLQAFNFSKRLINEMIKLCKANNIKFLLLCLNDHHYKPEVEKRKLKRYPTFNYLYIENELKKLASKQEIYFLGLQKAFRNYYLKFKRDLHWVHYNYEGHRLVAKLLSKKIKEIAEVNNWCINED